jgi:hypothetical protein
MSHSEQGLPMGHPTRTSWQALCGPVPVCGLWSCQGPARPKRVAGPMDPTDGGTWTKERVERVAAGLIPRFDELLEQPLEKAEPLARVISATVEVSPTFTSRSGALVTTVIQGTCRRNCSRWKEVELRHLLLHSLLTPTVCRHPRSRRDLLPAAISLAEMCQFGCDSLKHGDGCSWIARRGHSPRSETGTCRKQAQPPELGQRVHRKDGSMGWWGADGGLH